MVDEPQQPTESRHVLISKGVGTFLVSAAFIAVVGFLIGAFQIAGVVSVGIAHLLITLAWAVAVFAVWGWLLSRPQKHTGKIVLLTALTFALIFIGLDFLMVWLKAEQEHRPQPSVRECLSPITTYLQSVPWKWIAISLAAGLIIAAWPLITLLRGERRRAASRVAELESRVDKAGLEKESLEVEHRAEIERLEGEKASLEGSIKTLKTQHESEKDELNKRVVRLNQEIDAYSKGADGLIRDRDLYMGLRDSLQAELDARKWTDEVVGYQRNGLRKYVLVESCIIDDSPLSEGKDYFEITFNVFNYSIFSVFIPTPADRVIGGTINFKGEPLSGTAKLIENEAEKLPPYHGDYFKIRQWVNPNETKDIPETLKTVGNFFDFSEAIIYVKAERFSDDVAAKLDLTRAMQNTKLENENVELRNATKRLNEGLILWHDRAGKIKELYRTLGMFYLAYNQTEQRETLSEETGNNLKGRFMQALNFCFHANSIVDAYSDNLPAFPKSFNKQRTWVDAQCFILRRLIDEQTQGLADHVKDDPITPTSHPLPTAQQEGIISRLQAELASLKTLLEE